MLIYISYTNIYHLLSFIITNLISVYYYIIYLIFSIFFSTFIYKHIKDFSVIKIYCIIVTTNFLGCKYV